MKEKTEKSKVMKRGGIEIYSTGPNAGEEVRTVGKGNIPKGYRIEKKLEDHPQFDFDKKETQTISNKETLLWEKINKKKPSEIMELAQEYKIKELDITKVGIDRYMEDTKQKIVDYELGEK